MKSTLIFSVQNNSNLSQIFKSLSHFNSKLIFIDVSNSESSWDSLQKFTQNKNIPTIRAHRGAAHALNEAIQECKGEIILFLENLIPNKNWESKMLSYLEHAQISVGNTIYQSSKGIYSELAKKLFDRYPERTSQAKGHALPWGPINNLGIHRSIFEQIGSFSEAAEFGFDIDWCWRAVLNGAKISFAKEAEAKINLADTRETLIRKFEQYGLSEAWLHKTYSFLSESEFEDPLFASIAAFERLRYHSNASTIKKFHKPLEEIAVAFSSGIRSGLERPLKPCQLKREFQSAIGWDSGKNEVTVLVPGKGLATLKGKPASIWHAMQNGSSDQELELLFCKLFKVSHEVAHHEIESFKESLS